MLEGIPGIAARFYKAFAAKALGGFHRRIALEILSGIPSGSILDVGTGPGNLPLEMAGRAGCLKLVGIDISPAMIAMSRENSARIGTDNLSFDVADVHELPYPDGSFDFLVSTLALHHWRDRARAFEECYRVLKPGGSARIYEIRKDASWSEVLGAIKGRSAAERYLSFALHWHGLPTRDFYGEIRELLGEAGFRDITMVEEGPFMRIGLKR
ncbi:MAG: class I SAM-dependent methyltransferase [Candidatus Latescibacterota bacterium]